MSKRAAIAGLFAALIASGIFTSSAQQTTAPAASAGQDSYQTPPSDAEMRDRSAKLIANQHKDDGALDHYERIEREQETTGGPNARTIADRKTRLVPNGAGATKLLLEDRGRAVTPDEYRRELQNWLSVLQFMVNPNDERMKSAMAKSAKKKQSRSELVDAMMTAFIRRWVGREMLNGRDCDVFELRPDPNFHPHSMLEDPLTHATAKIWVDHDAVQLVRAEAHITSDVAVGGGVLGKLYKGGTFAMEQSEVAPGVWLPTRYQFDYSGREFLFSIVRHESIEVSHYRYIGSAKEALAVAQSELAGAKPVMGDP
jgi:hypothetical protein